MTETTPHTPLVPKLIPLPNGSEPYTRLLGGCLQDSAGMKSGCVVLAPGENVGEHSTHDHEEILVPLSGTGELRIPGQPVFTVQPGCLLYNPPDTLHDVVNTGSQPLRYVFIVCPARP
ncbi:MAG: cupin domain-containing protein [Anaerolineaceae bacterium]